MAGTQCSFGVVAEDGHFINSLENHGKDFGFYSDVGGHWKYLNGGMMIAFYLEFENIILADLWRINL